MSTNNPPSKPTLVVVDQDTQAPIPGVQVVGSDGFGLGVTDTQGRVTIPDDYLKSKTIRLSCTGYLSYTFMTSSLLAAESVFPLAKKEQPVGSTSGAEQAAQSGSTNNPQLVKVTDLVQNQTAVAICRVHVYREDDVPGHWAGPPKYRKNPTKPYCVIGVGGKYVQASAQGSEMPWQVLSARVSLTRQLSCSSASLQFAAASQGDEFPPLFPIRPNDLIAIEMGYARGMDSPVANPDGSTNYDAFSGDCVFFGMVHDIRDHGGSGENDGQVITVMARDFLSFLVDNKIRGHYTPKTLDTEYNRAYVIRDLILRGAAKDYVQWDAPAPDGTRRPKQAVDGTILPARFTLDNCYLRFGQIEVSNRIDVLPDKVAEAMQQGIVLMDRFPLDVIKHFMLVETAPREIWADPRTGEVHCMFRRTDARTLYRTPHFRQYFYRFPEARANILSYTNEWSTAGTVTHFTLSNPLSSVSGAANVQDIYAESGIVHLTDPHTGEKLRRITRNRFAYDDTLFDENVAAVVVSALLEIWGRAIETGTLVIPGDPTLEIGEAIQMFNTQLFGRRCDAEGKNHFGEDALKVTPDGYNDAGHNPEGIYRVEAISHNFAQGGVSRGYTTALIFGPCDPPTGSPLRMITKDSDFDDLQLIDPALIPQEST